MKIHDAIISVEATDTVMLTIEAAAKRYSLSKSTIYRLLKGGKIRGKKYGVSTRIIMASLDQHMMSLPDFGS